MLNTKPSRLHPPKRSTTLQCTLLLRINGRSVLVKTPKIYSFLINQQVYAQRAEIDTRGTTIKKLTTLTEDQQPPIEGQMQRKEELEAYKRANTENPTRMTINLTTLFVQRINSKCDRR